jgi:hypothetical protein
MTKFVGVRVESRVRRAVGPYGIRKEIVVQSKQYRKVMNLMGDCLKVGGHVDFEHKGETVDVELHWPNNEVVA